MAQRQARNDQGKVQHKTATFSFSAALLEELGERLVSKPEVALAELIKNSYDADATTCTIDLDGDEIVVTDDGHGMTEQQFLNNWMVVSSQAKGLQRFSRRYKRRMAGSKGIGRFSARFLGRIVHLQSTCKDDATSERTRLTAKFDWDAFKQEDAIASVPIAYTVEVVDDSVDIGTSLRITKLRREASQISAAKVKSDILRLTNPITGLERPPFRAKPTETGGRAEKDPGFSVQFSDEEDEADAELAPSVQEAIVGAFVGRARVHLDDKGTLTYQVFWRGGTTPIQEDSFDIAQYCRAYTPEKLRADGDKPRDERGLLKEVENIQQLPLATRVHSPIFIDLRFFPKRKGTFSGLGVNGFTAQRWIREHASFAIVDNLFAMNGYGSGSDWLGIDASKATNQRDWQSIFTPIFFPMSASDKADPGRNPMLALPRGTQLIGRVHIATRKRPSSGADDSEEWLQPNMDRESLRDNGAFRVLWHVSRFAAELIAHFDRADRLREEDRANAAAVQEAKDALSRAITEIRSSKSIEPEYRQQIVQHLKIAQTRYAESAQYDREARDSLELMSMMGVIAGFMTHEFEKAMRTLTDAAALIRSLARKDPSLGATANEVDAMERSLAHYMDYMRLFINRARQPRAQTFKANAQVTLVVETLASISQAHHVSIEVQIENSLPGPVMPVAAYHGIVANLVSNSLKALIPRISDDPRKVRIYATNDGSRHILVCADNGIGIPDYLRDRIWDPLYSTTTNVDEDNPLASGLGLGLSVVRKVVQKMRGSIELMDEPPPGFATAFRVSLPLK